MLCHPALVLAQVGSDAQRKALFAQQHVSAVTGVDGNDGVVLREVADIALLLIDVCTCSAGRCTQSLLSPSASEHFLAHAGHDGHVQHNIDGVGQLNADFGKAGSRRGPWNRG